MESTIRADAQTRTQTRTWEPIFAWVGYLLFRHAWIRTDKFWGLKEATVRRFRPSPPNYCV